LTSNWWPGKLWHYQSTVYSRSIQMAKQKVNKSKAVREYVKSNPKAKNQEVAEALGKQGIKVSANYVATIRSTSKRRRRAVRKVVAKGGVGIPEVKAALAFLKLTGSVAAATQALAVAQEIREIV